MSTRILVVGGGYVGLYTALGLEKRLTPDEAEVTLVAPDGYMVYQPFLPEAASGAIEPRHVVVPLRRVLRRTRLMVGEVAEVDHGSRTAVVEDTMGQRHPLGYDHIVVGLGSVSRVLPVPGLAERGVGFKSVEEAIFLRNHVLACIDAAANTGDHETRRRLLTFVFVGGGYAGVEALAELEDMARDACKETPEVSRSDMRWVLVEAMPGILPELGETLGGYAVEHLRSRGIEVRLTTRLESAQDGVMRLSDGQEFPADTLVWTTGVKAHPLIAELGFTIDDRGRLEADEYLRVRDAEGAWTAGDCAAVPDLASGGVCPPTAQHALRQARQLAANLAATLRGVPPTPFRYRSLGFLLSLGRYKGVARVLGIRLWGFPAWFLHRTYHVMMVPSLNRKVRIVMDWTVSLLFRRDVVQLGSLRDPRRPFVEAHRGG